MCGIAGVIRLDGGLVDVSALRAAALRLRHRGPDGEGFLLGERTSGWQSLRNSDQTPPGIEASHISADFAGRTPDLAFAHRRLAILDLSPGGHEPMSIDDGRLWITFNGEIYNYLELRADLAAIGHSFRTENDVEVLLRAYDEWGTGCLDRCIGMFAFALWDRDRGRVWCARDRLGIKPFYYAVRADRFVFASEIKAIFPLLGEAPRPNLPMLYAFLTAGRVTNAPETFFAGLHELPGGHDLLIEGEAVSAPRRWWTPQIPPSAPGDPAVNVRRLLDDAVRLRLRSDVPVGTCLSGGLDSSSIVALATQALEGGRISSFSSVYRVAGFDESRFIDWVADHFQTRRHTISPDPTDYLARMERITWHQDIPTNGASIFTQNDVMKLAQGNVTVLLDGQGADELFAGYLSHVVKHLEILRRHDPLRWAGEFAHFAGAVWSRFNPALSVREFAARIADYARRSPTPQSLLPYELQGETQRHLQDQRALLPSLNGVDALNAHLSAQLLRDSIPALLHYEDRNSMAYGIEARVPFLDHRLVEYGLSIPAAHKVRGADTKIVLRRAMRGLLPDTIVDRKDKLGYPTPFGTWIRGALHDPVREFLFDRVATHDWIDRASITRIWDAHQEGRVNAAGRIASAINADIWWRLFIEDGAAFN